MRPASVRGLGALALVVLTFAWVATTGTPGAATVAADTTPPVLTLPDSVRTKATRPAGTFVGYLAVATDDVVPSSLACDPASGALFPIGPTTVHCRATDAAGNAATGTFTVTVVSGSAQITTLIETTARLLLPRGTEVSLLAKLESAEAAAGRGQSKTACNILRAFANEVGAQTGKSIPATAGPTLVDGAEAIRAALGCASSSAPPVLAGPRADVSTGTAPGRPTAIVLYTDTSSGPLLVACIPPSGSAFPLGRTTVECGARDDAGRTARATFLVTVVDREPPVLTVPANIAVNAPPGASSAVVSFSATATDNVAVASVGCVPTSGSTFALGTTTVGCTATDTSGNTASATFTVTVELAISGRVTDRAAGVPIAGIRVAVFDASSLVRVAFTSTDADGRYSIAVPPGTYKVGFNFDRAMPYVPQAWDGRSTVQDGDAIAVSRSVSGIDTALVPGRFIRGHVTDAATGEALQGISVSAHEAGTPSCCTFVSGTGTDEHGDYALVVPAGSSVKVFFGPPGSRYLAQWWNGKAFFEQADVLTMTVDRSGIDARLVSGLFIRGHVSDAATHLPIEGVTVNAHDASVPCCRFLAGTRTDAGGDYALLVPSGGSVRVQFGVFNPPPGTRAYLEQWWQGKPNFAVADVLAVSADRSGIDAQLIPGFFIRGRVSDAATGQPVQGGASAYDATLPCCRQVAGTGTDPNGNYALVVPAGSYKVQFHPPQGSRLLGQWWQGKSSFETADVLAISADRSGIDAQLASGFLISGRVTDQTTGLPVEGMNVQAQDATTPFCCSFVAGAPTDANGEYRFAVPAGSYKVQFFRFNPPPGTRAYLEQWWQGKPNFEAADVLAVSADRSGIDAQLIPGFFIRGRISDAATGQPLSGIGVNANDATTFCCVFIGGTSTDQHGDYALVVPAGRSVKLFFGPPLGSRYLGEWWNDKSSFEQADVLAMTADRSGIDAALATGVLISGRVTDAADPGRGVGDISVIAQCCFGTRTAADGTYTLAVPAGTYRLSFFPPPGSDLLPQHWNNKHTFQDADLLTVPSATVDLTAINAVLEHGIRVSGTVTEALSGAVVARVGVVATLVDPSAPCCLNLFASTAPDGTYSLFVRAGGYKISFQPSDDTGLIAEFWNDKRDFGSADVLLVSAPTSGIDAALERGFRVSGRVTDAADPPQAIARVGVTIQSATCCSFFTVRLTANDGTYSVIVPAGSYKVGFFPPFGSDLAGEFWNDKPDVASADVLVVADHIGGIDAALERGLRVSGRVTSETGTGIAGASVSVFTASCASSIVGGSTGPDGTYSLVVRAGSYKLAFFAPFGSDLLSEFWNDKPDCASADILPVSADTVVDAVLRPAIRISGRVTDAAGRPIQGVIANIVLADAPPCCRFLFGASTDADGRYSADVPAGSYKVFFFPGLDVPFLAEWWNDKPNFDAADRITVTSSVTIDAVLERGVLISGRVTDETTGLRLQGASVGLYDGSAPCCAFIDGRGTNAEGRYSFAVRPGSYKINFFPPSGSDLVGEWWNDQPSFASADVLTGAADHLGTDAALGRAAPPVLTGATLAPLAASGPTSPDATTAAVNDGSAGEATFTFTFVDQNGNAFPLPPGASAIVTFAVSNDGPGTIYVTGCDGTFVSIAVIAGSTNATCSGTVGPSDSAASIEIDSASPGSATIRASSVSTTIGDHAAGPSTKTWSGP